jgi:hypothetical protein
MLLGTLIGLVVARRTPGAEGWLRLYSEATSALMFALLAAVIYSSIMRSRRLAARSRAGLELNVFDGHLLTPFAQWGQSLSLVFVGGVSLSLLFQSYESLRSMEGVIVYGSLVIVALTLFFMSMWTIHVALARAQDKELARGPARPGRGARSPASPPRLRIGSGRAGRLSSRRGPRRLRAAGAGRIDLALQSDDRRARVRVRGRAARRLPPEARLRRGRRTLAPGEPGSCPIVRRRSGGAYATC